MATPGYDGQVIRRDCDCEDFPCCGHGITANSAESIEDYYCDRCGSNHVSLYCPEDSDEEFDGDES